MPAQSHSTVWSAFLSPTSDTVAVGSCMIPDADAEYYIIASSANRTAAVRTSRASGLAITAGDSINRHIEIQTVGPCPPNLTGLAAGTASDLRVSSAGRLERATLSGSDIYAGRCDADGWAYLDFAGTPSSVASTTTVTADDGLHVTGTASAPVVRANRKTCTLEMFNAAAGTGTAATDEAAMVAAVAAIGAGTYSGLVFGAATYTLAGPFTLPAGTYSGQGDRSILSTTTDGVLLQVNAEGTVLKDFRIQGDNGTSAQYAIKAGDGATCPASIRIHGVNIEDCYYGIVFTGGTAATYDGSIVSDCRVEDCNICFRTDSSAEYITFSNCHAFGSLPAVRSPGSGFDVASGNISVIGGSSTKNVYGCRLIAGANDAHGIFCGTQLNHNASPVLAGAILYGHTFTACHMYGGELWLNGSSGVSFFGCTMNLDAGSGLLCNSAVATRVVDCIFPTNIGVSIDATSEVVFTNPRLRDSNAIPANIGAVMQLGAWAFASDANDTLTLQESCADTLIVANGTISVARQITNARTPARGHAMRVVNGNTYDVTFKWATGTAVTIATGTWALVGADGTNAIVLENEGGGGTITGTDTHVMFFDGANTPAGEAGLTYAKGSDTLTAVGGMTCSGFVADSTDVNFKVPIAGSSADSVPFRLKVASVSCTAGGGGTPVTATASQYECPIIYLTGTPSGTFSFILPSTDGATFNVRNDLTIRANVLGASDGGAGVPLGSTSYAERRWVSCKATNYEKMEFQV